MNRASRHLQEYKIAFNSGLGMWAFFLHKATGILMAIYLLSHVYTIIIYARDLDAFSKAIDSLFTPWVVLPLLAILLYHALNGVRILFFDLGIGIKKQGLIFLTLMLIGLAAWILGTASLYEYVF